MKRIVVVTTGGTIASRWRGTGYAAEAAGAEVLGASAVPEGVRPEVVDLFTVNSARLTSGHQLRLVRAVREALSDPSVDGVVVTHGTDTLEESAFLLDLYHDDPRPVVLTGAQLPLENPDSDAAGNLHDALLTAAGVRDLGVVTAFAGRIHAARGTVKTRTIGLDAFADPSGAPLGSVVSGLVEVARRPSRGRPLALPPTDVEPPRVDIVVHHPDADPLLLRTAVDAGAAGLVLVGTGAGNATPETREAVADAVSRGVLVALTTRVPSGPVTPIYTGGGAVDLIAAGAVPTGTLRAGQARIAVLAALMSTADPEGRRSTLHRLVEPGAGAAAA
ncbi:asparaginase [Streptomyces sp. TP-A0874]|uniref:asparaginase n=1 Tax=Streptomyces sp. TP-A0874 TaxID=549819 RepID=UPI0008529014|nr:asparaginase [Streptomyces sp. TP-A0874]